MNGWAASPGTAIGRAALVIDSDDIVRVQRGAIIISKAASPELAIVISKVRAIATEYGGQGAVASGLAREYGIPAVVGVKGLTEVIRDGDLVRVNGTKGTVEIVELTV
jgi:pyruvate,water dikinase